MIYEWKQGFRANVPAEVAGRECERLAKEHRLTGRDLVEESRPEDAPLHRYFEWNDTKAAELYRERQGRDLIAHIVLVQEEKEEESKEPVPVRVRAFHNVDETAEYHPIQRVLTNEDLHQKLLESARKDMIIFREKYKTLVELESVISAINDNLGGKEPA